MERPTFSIAPHRYTSSLIIDGTESETTLPDLRAPGVEVWRDTAGTVAAVGYRHAGQRCLGVPNVGTFTFTDASVDIRLTREASASDELVEDAFHRIVLPLALQLRAVQVLHASAVVSADGVVALCGRSGAGKSTLAYGLSRRGHTLWADDALAFEPSHNGLQAIPLPFRMRLRPASAQWFDDLEHQKGSELSAPWDVGVGPQSFRALFVLKRAAGTTTDDQVDIVRLAPADAFAAVLPHAYYLALDDEQLNQRLLSSYLVLAERLPVFVLRYAPRLTLVEDIASLIEEAVAEL